MRNFLLPAIGIDYNTVMDLTILTRINRAQTASYLFRFSLLGFLIVSLGIIALVIKINAFPASASEGYIIFITRNLVLSVILLTASSYAKRNNTRFAVSFDRAPGWLKLSWLVGFTIFSAAVYELLKRMLS